MGDTRYEIGEDPKPVQYYPLNAGEETVGTLVIRSNLAFSSDWNVAEMEPVIGIYTALTRKGLDGKPEGGWIPEQTVDLETAIRGYTINGAYANFVEGNRGSITPGKYADLVLLSDDLFKISPDKIKDAKTVWTVVGGRQVYRAF